MQYLFGDRVITGMKKIFLITVAAFLVAGCNNNLKDEATIQVTDTTTDVLCKESMSLTGCYKLSSNAALKLFEGNDHCLLEMDYGDEMQELIATGNTHYIRNDQDQIHLDTVHLDKDYTVYFIKTADNSSTYGAEIWYITYPYDAAMQDGPWCLYKLPFDLLELKDTDGDGYPEILSYNNINRTEIHTYRFLNGILTQTK